MADKLNLFQKIADVKANIDGFTKDTEGYKYHYVSGSQVLHKIRAKMEEHNLLFMPTIESAEYKEIEVLEKGKMKPNILVAVNLKYTWVNADNPEERFEMPFYAVGHQDDASKALGTALTYSERYLLMKMFNIPTDEDDADAKQKKEQYAPKASQQDVQRYNDSVNAFVDLMAEAGNKDLTPAMVGEKVGVTDPRQLTQEQINQAIAVITKWSNQARK